jgi:hypothetical protein
MSSPIARLYYQDGGALIVALDGEDAATRFESAMASRPAARGEIWSADDGQMKLVLFWELSAVSPAPDDGVERTHIG